MPVKAPEDPSGVLAKMPPDVRAAYNGYDVPITASPWHNFEPKGSGPYDVAIVYSSTSVPYQKTMLDTVTKALEGSELVGDVSVSLYETDPAAARGGALVIAKQRTHVGVVHAGRTPTVEAADATWRIYDEAGLIAEVARTTTKSVARFKVHKPEPLRPPTHSTTGPA